MFSAIVEVVRGIVMSMWDGPHGPTPMEGEPLPPLPGTRSDAAQMLLSRTDLELRQIDTVLEEAGAPPAEEAYRQRTDADYSMLSGRILGVLANNRRAMRRLKNPRVPTPDPQGSHTTFGTMRTSLHY